jgi:hypothetical protein
MADSKSAEKKKKYAVRRKVKHDNKLYAPSAKAAEPNLIELTESQAAPLLKVGAITE